jgi:ribonuclease HII
MYYSVWVKTTEWIIGIDEVGRGPLAGPIAVGAVALPFSYAGWEHWDTLKDSKKLSEKRRTAWDVRIRSGDVPCAIRYAVSMVHATLIDEQGIQHAARKAASEALAGLQLAPHEATVLLDKGLSVTTEWDQQQFIKGDEQFPAIALASVVAKVARDEYMARLALQYPLYLFDVHKGYGTAKHRDAIQQHGLIPEIHRTSFCTRLTVKR